MPTLTSHKHGSFCWVELMTPDAGAAKFSLFVDEVQELIRREDVT